MAYGKLLVHHTDYHDNKECLSAIELSLDDEDHSMSVLEAIDLRDNLTIVIDFLVNPESDT